MYCPESIDQSYFVVTFANAVVVDVSDILTFRPDSNPVVTSGKYDTGTGLLNNLSVTFGGTIIFDEAAVGYDNKFYLSGLVTGTGTDKVQSPFYVETWKLSVKSAYGTGSNASYGIYSTGSFSFSGTVQGSLPRP